MKITIEVDAIALMIALNLAENELQSRRDMGEWTGTKTAILDTLWDALNEGLGDERTEVVLKVDGMMGDDSENNG